MMRISENPIILGHKRDCIYHPQPLGTAPAQSCYSRNPPYTDPQFIIDAIKEYSFIANCTSMMKSRKTGRPMPLYVVNVLPRANFEEIYQINEICYIRVTTERFKGTGIVSNINIEYSFFLILKLRSIRNLGSVTVLKESIKLNRFSNKSENG